MDREPPESRLKMELDRLSNLPNELIEKILLFLPIREAVRTSVLSTKWRKKPAMLPDLWFDKRCISSTTKKTLANVVDHVLLGHIGPIRMFTLCNENELSREDMDRWILHLSRNGITDFRLNWKGRLYKIPSCLLSCEDLNALALGKCLIKPPPTFVGFKNLSQLSLTKVGLAGDVLENLILRCPNLENLVLNDCAGFNHLKIDAPNLVYLWVKGVFKHVSLGNTKLNHVAVTLNRDVANDQRMDQRMAPRSSSNLLNVLGKLPRIQMLYVNSFFLKYLGVGAVPGKLPNPLEYLKSLLIEIEFHDHKGILTTICLLRSSPALQELEIAAPSKKVAVGEVNYASEENRNCQFSQLRRVRILGISAVRGELDFVQFLLSSSPVLERMTVKPFSNSDVLELLKHLVQFRRASAKAEITLD